MGIAALEQQIAENDQRTRDAILDALAELGGNRTTYESGVAYHGGKQILLPTGMSLKVGAKLLTTQAAAMEEEHDFNNVFQCRPWDGAYALQEVLKRVFGVGGQGKAQYTMFGQRISPQFINVEVAPGKKVRVPWGMIDFPLLEATMTTNATIDPNRGALFALSIDAPKKYESQIEGLFIAVERWLKDNSIYKGKAIVGVGKVVPGQGFENPTFLDPDAIDPATVAYSEKVYNRLNLSVWGPIRTAQAQRDAKLKLNKKTLLYGPYGTGKSLAGGLTAKVATENGWTFIQCKTGDDDLNMVLKMAELYAPAVVFIEDIDILIERDPKEMAKLLEQFDGVSSKDKEVMVLMTSNHVDALSKGMTRAGRIDAAIEIGSLDVPGIQRLISATFDPETLDENVNWEEIYEAMAGYEPAFIMGTFSLTKSAAIVRTGQAKGFKLTTEDFVVAAETLRNQHDTHTNANERPPTESVSEVLGSLMEEAATKVLAHHRVEFPQGNILAVNA